MFRCYLNTSKRNIIPPYTLPYHYGRGGCIYGDMENRLMECV
nr:MAG TPA: hypothetical protein [Caudoviricetes sp.]